MTTLSILDLVRVTEDTDARGALYNARDLARHAEAWGYRRFWVAEHHNMPGIASAATSIVIAHIAAGTQSIRVGAGGIMLPNHSPLVIAEQFGTLARLFPDRIDLGLGRAPGTDQRHAARAAPFSRGGRAFSGGRAGAAGISCSAATGPARPGGAGRRNEGAALDSRIEPVWRLARGGTRPALCFRVAFRPGSASARLAAISQPLQAVRTARPALRDGGRQHHRRRQRC